MQSAAKRQDRAPLSVSAIEASVEAMIIAGELEPGAHVNESSIAAQLGVGRASVREACRLLERAGLVHIRPNQGTFVRTIDIAEVVHLFDIRASLGRLAGRSAAAAIDAKQLAALHALLAKLDEAAAGGDADAYITLNLAFHTALYEATGNARLAALDQAIGKELRIYRRHGLAHGGGLRVSNREHRSIVEALEQGDCERAGNELERHIAGGRDRFLRAMSATGRLALQDGADRPA
jgi:DNA-binding GntR family transcriptional regulator